MAGRTKDTSCPQSAPVCGSNAGGDIIGPSRHLKAPACKRAATDRDNLRMASTAPTQQSKRRAPLSNLTNQTTGSRAQIAAPKNKTLVAVSKARHHEKGASVFRTGAASTDDISMKSKESLKAQITDSHADKTLDVVVGPLEVDVIAALEQETKHHLYISGNSRTLTTNQDTVLEDSKGSNHGCSNQSFMDIDNNHKDPQLCSSYAKDIYEYLQISELKRRPNMNYMKAIQNDINESMRGILVDWLVEVAEEYKLVPDTLYLTVAYVDRFLSTKIVDRQRLQLLGVACMLVAAKFEEICAPQVEEFCYITDNTYSRDEVLDMERQVLNQLHFEVTGPTTKTFLRRFLKAAQVCQKSATLHMEFLANCFAELTLLEYDFLKYLPSMIAGSAVFLAKFTLDPNAKPWNTTLQHYTGYKPSELKDCVQAIHAIQDTTNSSLHAIWEKYRQHKFKCVADIISPSIIPADYFKDL